MEVIKIKTGGLVNLILGIISAALFIFFSVFIIYLFFTSKEYFAVVLTSFLDFILYCMASVMLRIYKNRKEIELFLYEKDGIINFGEILKEYIQVKDYNGKLTFIRKEDYNFYLDYELLNK